MLDFGQKWEPASFDETGFANTDTVNLVRAPSRQILMVSGNVGRGLASLGITTHPLGATDVIVEEPYAVALARDKCLAVVPSATSVEEGWHPDGYAVTDATDGYIGFDISGAGLSGLLKRATALDWSQPTRSSAISFGHATVVTAFLRDRDSIRLLIETPMVPSILLWIKTTIENH